MKRFGTLALLIIILSAIPAMAQDATASTTASAPAATAEAAAPAATAPAGEVDRSRLTPSMQGFMSKVDELKARRSERETQGGRVLPEGPPIDSGAWHKAQGHRRVFGWPSAGRRHRKAKKETAEASTSEEKSQEPAKEEKKDDKK